MTNWKNGDRARHRNLGLGTVRTGPGYDWHGRDEIYFVPDVVDSNHDQGQAIRVTRALLSKP